MTVRYAAPIATNTSLGCFTTLLFRWRGSVYKLIWAEYLVFLSLYYAISLVYRFGLNDDHQRFFEKIVNYCEKSENSVEMSFVLGFFVTSIVSKWWQLYNTIPWPDPIALQVNANIRGEDEWTKECKQTLIRYCNLNLILTFRSISPPYKGKYPSLNHFVKEGLLLEEEMAELKQLDMVNGHMRMEWLPITWATELVMKARDQGRIASDFACQRIIDEMDKFRHGCALLMEYENCSVPLVYIQVVTIAVYTHFLSCLFGSQWLKKDPKLDDLDLYFPFFTTLQFIFYMGWLKVAESLVNPFGTDDDDFELDEIFHRHTQVSSMMVFGSGKDEKGLTVSDHNNRVFSEYVNEGFNGYPENDKSKATQASSNGSATEERMASVSPPPPNFSDVVATGTGDEESGKHLHAADDDANDTKC